MRKPSNIFLKGILILSVLASRASDASCVPAYQNYEHSPISFDDGVHQIGTGNAFSDILIGIPLSPVGTGLIDVGAGSHTLSKASTEETQDVRDTHVLGRIARTIRQAYVGAGGNLEGLVDTIRKVVPSISTAEVAESVKRLDFEGEFCSGPDLDRQGEFNEAVIKYLIENDPRLTAQDIVDPEWQNYFVKHRE